MAEFEEGCCLGMVFLWRAIGPGRCLIDEDTPGDMHRPGSRILLSAQALGLVDPLLSSAGSGSGESMHFRPLER